MKVTRMELSADDAEEPQVFGDPSWQDVEAAIRGIDGVSCDSVVLTTAEGQDYMGIAGDEEGRFVVAGATGGRTFIFSSGVGDGAETIYVSVGGQENPYADREIADLDQALMAARTFYETGECHSGFRWDARPARMEGVKS